MKGSSIALIGGGVILLYMIGTSQGNASTLTAAQLAALQTAQGTQAYNNALNSGASVSSALAAAIAASGGGGGYPSGTSYTPVGNGQNAYIAAYGASGGYG